MAENRGGMRPTAPQNNPANISATGGAGQSGKQPARYMAGLAYGQGQAQMQQQTAAPMSAGPTMPTRAPMSMAPQLPEVTPITAPTQRPDVPITNGIDMGPGAGSEALKLPAAVPQGPMDNSAKLIQALYLQDPSNEDVRRMLEYLSAEGRI
jgi:hypothetical protein